MIPVFFSFSFAYNNDNVNKIENLQLRKKKKFNGFIEVTTQKSKYSSANSISKLNEEQKNIQYLNFMFLCLLPFSHD